MSYLLTSAKLGTNVKELFQDITRKMIAEALAGILLFPLLSSLLLPSHSLNIFILLTCVIVDPAKRKPSKNSKENKSSWEDKKDGFFGNLFKK